MATVQPYQYVQNTPSAVWSINHNLGVYPVVDVVVYYQGAMTKIIPQDIVVIDVNNIEIRFTTPYSGQARLM